MKTMNQQGFRIVLIISALLFSQLAKAQNSMQGKWTGTFMEQFQVTVEFNLLGDETMSGKLMMYAGDNMIQSDDLINISLDQNEVTFEIPAKETIFTGILNSSGSVISGNFVFPDGSLHTLILNKSDTDDNNRLSGMETFSEMKNKKIPAEALKEDLDFLKDKLAENHPQLYRYVNKTDFERAYEKAKQTAVSGMDLIEFYQLASSLTEMIRCSHTGVKLPDEYVQSSQEFDRFFPLKLLFTPDRVYLDDDIHSPASDIKKGAEILAINDQSITEIKESIFKLIPSEGYNSTTKYFMINKEFSTYFNIIDQSDSDSYELQFRGPDNSTTKTVEIPGRSHYEVFGNSGQRNLQSNLQFSLDQQNNIAILKIDGFVFSDVNQYIADLDWIFKDIIEEKTGNLVLDLRGNQGGHPIFAAQLISYLIDHDFTYFKRNADVAEFEPLYNPMHANPIHYGGRVFVFVDGGCLSTTGHLISLLQFYSLAEFIGEQPGSSSTCNDFSIQYRLPNTGIELNVPRETFQTVAAGMEREDDPIKIAFSISKGINEISNDADPYFEVLLTVLTSTPSK